MNNELIKNIDLSGLKASSDDDLDMADIMARKLVVGIANQTKIKNCDGRILGCYLESMFNSSFMVLVTLLYQSCDLDKERTENRIDSLLQRLKNNYLTSIKLVDDKLKEVEKNEHS